MKKQVVFAILGSAIGVIFFILLIVVWLLKVLWSWTIPEIFPGAVEQGLIAGSISWITALKVILLATALFSFLGIPQAGKRIPR